LKIGQHLAKLWAKVGCPVFLTHGVMTCWTGHDLYGRGMVGPVK